MATTHIDFAGKNSVKILSRDDHIDFFSAGQGFIEGYKVCPTKTFLVEENGHKLLCLPSESGEKAKTIHMYDTERGSEVSKFSFPWEFVDVQSAQKFGNLEQKSTFQIVGVAKDHVVNVVCDPRAQKHTLTLAQEQFVSYKTASPLTVVSTSKDRQIAVGDSSGIVRLFSDPTKTKKGLTRAKTKLDHNVSKSPVIGIDVSHDGKWVLWTTNDAIYIINTDFRDKNTNAQKNGFNVRMGTQTKNTMCICHTSELCQQFPQLTPNAGREVSFSPAKFDHSSQTGGVENTIVTTCGGFAISWKMRHIANDYKRNRFSAEAQDKDRRAHLVQLARGTLGTGTFGYGNCAKTFAMPATLTNTVNTGNTVNTVNTVNVVETQF